MGVFKIERTEEETGEVIVSFTSQRSVDGVTGLEHALAYAKKVSFGDKFVVTEVSKGNDKREAPC